MSIQVWARDPNNLPALKDIDNIVCSPLYELAVADVCFRFIQEHL